MIPRRYKPYPAYKDSGIEWLGDIPEHWEVKRITELTTLVNGFPFDSEHFALGDGVPLVRIRDLYETETEVNYTGPVVEGAWIDTGDVIVGMDGDFNVLRWRGPRALLNQRMCCFRQRGSTDSAFVAYLLPSPLKVINDLAYATTVKHLSSHDIRKICIGAPPAAEQRAIAAFLDRETARIDALIANKERLIELLQEKRLALITQAVTKGLDPTVPMKESGVEWLGKIPAHWVVTRLRHAIAGIEQGWSPLCENRLADESEWGVMKVGCVNGEDFDESEHKALPADLRPMVEYEIHPGDILMSRANTRELLGNAVLVRTVRARLLLCDKLYRIRESPGRVLSKFIVRAIASRVARFQLEREASGASGSMQNISQEAIVNLLLPLPPPAEQHRIVAFLDRESAQTGALIAKIRIAIDRLTELRTALISAAVTGKIDVRKEAA